MQRREWVNVLGCMAGAMVFGLPAAAQAQGAAPREDVDYVKLDRRVPVEAPAGKIEVVEFFWYRCPHCNVFEPTLEAWSKSLAKDVVLRRVPVAFQDSFVPLQRLYYALEAMGLTEKLHTKVFSAIHKERIPLEGGDSIIQWVVQQRVDRAKFVEQFNSFSVSAKVTKATQLQNGYRVEGVPAMGVAGRFYSDGAIARTMERVLQVVDALVANLRSKRV